MIFDIHNPEFHRIAEGYSEEAKKLLSPNRLYFEAENCIENLRGTKSQGWWTIQDGVLYTFQATRWYNVHVHNPDNPNFDPANFEQPIRWIIEGLDNGSGFDDFILSPKWWWENKKDKFVKKRRPESYINNGRVKVVITRDPITYPDDLADINDAFDKVAELRGYTDIHAEKYALGSNLLKFIWYEYDKPVGASIFSEMEETGYPFMEVRYIDPDSVVARQNLPEYFVSKYFVENGQDYCSYEGTAVGEERLRAHKYKLSEGNYKPYGIIAQPTVKQSEKGHNEAIGKARIAFKECSMKGWKWEPKEVN